MTFDESTKISKPMKISIYIAISANGLIEAKIIGDDEWIFSLRKGVLIIENRNMRLTGEINKSKDTIFGKWEVQDKIGNWNYWYDVILTKIV